MASESAVQTPVDPILDHLHSVTKEYLFPVISTRPAREVLADGRNAYLIIQPWVWWKEMLHLRFDVPEAEVDPSEAVPLLLPVGRWKSWYRRGVAALKKFTRAA